MRDLKNKLLSSAHLPAALGTLLVTAAAAQAQQAENVDLPAVEVQANTATAWGPVGGYVATNSAAGTKTDTPLIETPRSISVVSSEEMSDRSAQSVVDAVGYTAGVVTGIYGYEPRFDVIYVRGFPTQLGDYKDGLRQANGSFAYFRTEPYGLERIDIIKGPASVLYGQTVPGGLVENRISKLPTDKAFGEAEVQVGDPAWYQVAFDFGGPATENGSVLYRITGVARKADGSVTDSPNNELYLAPSVTFRNDSTNLTIIASILDANVPASNYYLQLGPSVPPSRIPHRPTSTTSSRPRNRSATSSNMSSTMSPVRSPEPQVWSHRRARLLWRTLRLHLAAGDRALPREPQGDARHLCRGQSGGRRSSQPAP